jgi:hypothetical protein
MMTRHLALAALQFAQGCLRIHQDVLSGRDVQAEAGDTDFSTGTEQANHSQS